MALPAGLIAAAKNPVVQTVGLAGVGGLYNLISPDKQKQIMRGVLDDVALHQKGELRRSRGQFTAQEREQIMRQSEPQVNQVAANVASRGLGTSPAGAQIVAGAQQAPFQYAQQQAAESVPRTAQLLMNLSRGMSGNQQFHQLLGSISQSLQYMRESDAYGGPGQEPNNPTIIKAMQWLTGAFGGQQ